MSIVSYLNSTLKCNTHNWEFANSREKQDLLKIMFSELSISEKTIDYQVTRGLVPIQSSSLSLCTLIDNVRAELMKSEVIPYIPNLKAWAEKV
jgi:hypothetical protein